MEFLRFGSSIPGSYWGCCACCIIQNFKFDPDAKASIQLVSGDGGGPIINEKNEALFAGLTYRDIFWQRLRIGTFSKRDMPNHAFIAIMTQSQINGEIGKKWLAILKEAGFEFIRAVNNSVYSGQSLAKEPSSSYENGGSVNYIFMLVRNIGTPSLRDPFTPPKEWTALPKVKEEAWEWPNTTTYEELTKAQFAADKAIWEKIGAPKFFTEKEVEEAGVPVIYAGKRSKFPQQEKSVRQRAEEAQKMPEEKNSGVKIKKANDPFAAPPSPLAAVSFS